MVLNKHMILWLLLFRFKHQNWKGSYIYHMPEIQECRKITAHRTHFMMTWNIYQLVSNCIELLIDWLIESFIYSRKVNWDQALFSDEGLIKKHMNNHTQTDHYSQLPSDCRTLNNRHLKNMLWVIPHLSCIVSFERVCKLQVLNEIKLVG